MKNSIKDRIGLLEEHIRNSLDRTGPDSIRDIFFYSYRHANRLFKSLKGDSINAYAGKIRIQIAAEYLKYSSRSIADIAFTIGYETSSAFSKAFKKLYGQSPSAFRQACRLSNIDKNKIASKPSFTITYFEPLEVYTQKITISPEISLDELFHITQTTFKQLNPRPDQFLLLWDEDPALCQLKESRYFMGISSGTGPYQQYLKNTTTISGRYAIFDRATLEAYPYEMWHKVAYLILDLHGKQLREAFYLEWFASASLQRAPAFYPEKIAIPIL